MKVSVGELKRLFRERLMDEVDISQSGNAVVVYDSRHQRLITLHPRRRATAIKEDYLHGVPEWQLREDTKTFVDQIRDRVKAYILLNKSENSLDQQEAIAAMNDVLEGLEDKVYAVLENELYNFTRRV